MRGYRAKLKVVRRKKKDGTPYWAARGFVPIRRPDGSFARKRVEHGLGGNTAKARQEDCDRLNRSYEDRANFVPITFARAYLNYIEAGHPVPIFAERILGHLGVRQCHEVDDTIMLEVRDAIFKADAAASYVNRHLYTPVVAILHMALREAAPELTRPRGHSDITPIEIPHPSWFGTVAPFMGPDTLALMAFLTVHGRRLGDGLGRVPADFKHEAQEVEIDGEPCTIRTGTLSIGRTKTGEAMLIDLHPGVVALMLDMPDWERRAWLFSDGPGAGSNVRRDVLIACLRASGYGKEEAEAIAAKPTKHRAKMKAMSVPYFSPHEFGRHSFATRILRGGYSLQYLKDAGGWKTIEMPSRRYGHLERKEVTAAVHEVGDAMIAGLNLKRGGKPGARPPQGLLEKPVK